MTNENTLTPDVKLTEKQMRACADHLLHLFRESQNFRMAGCYRHDMFKKFERFGRELDAAGYRWGVNEDAEIYVCEIA